MKPALPCGGGLWAAMAIIQPMAFASAHIGSGPGVEGSSGMQVKPLEPRRTERIEPSGFIIATSASLPMEGGAASRALVISAASPVGTEGGREAAAAFGALLAAWSQAARAAAQAPTTSMHTNVRVFIAPELPTKP